MSPDGREAWAIEHENRPINILGAASGQTITRIPLQTADFGTLRFTPDERRVLLQSRGWESDDRQR